MPAKKPSGLIVKHETNAEKAARLASEEAMKAGRLPMDAPSYFKGHDRAAAIYREVMRSYSDLEADIVSKLDKAYLVRYCILVEQLEELLDYRAKLFDALRESPPAGMTFDAAFDKFLKLDARIDRKAELVQRHEQSLYLTPRSRAGVVPHAKAPEEPKDPMEELLNSFLEEQQAKGRGEL